MLRRHWFGILAVLVASAVLVGVILYYWLFPPHPPWELAPDSWLRPSPDHDYSKWIEVPQTDFRRAPLDRVDRAVRLLEDAPVVELGEEELVAFVPPPRPNLEGHRPYLVRGVMVKGWDGKPFGTGGFFVRRRDGQLWVYSGFLGSLLHPPRGSVRIPLVVWLASKPEAVFVEAQGVKSGVQESR